MQFFASAPNTLKQVGSFLEKNSVQCGTGIALIGLGLYLYNHVKVEINFDDISSSTGNKCYSISISHTTYPDDILRSYNNPSKYEHDD